MVDPHHVAHWYPTAAYLYVFWLDALALAWEYLRRHPDYRRDWLRRHRRPDAAHRWGLRLLEDPALDARDAHPAWLPGHAAVVQLYPDADPPQDAAAFAFWRIPGHKQLLHDGKGLALIARSPGHLPALRARAWAGRRHGCRLCPPQRCCSACAQPSTRCGPGRCQAQANIFRAAGTAYPAGARRDLGRRVLARGRRRLVRRGRRGRLVQRRRAALEGAPPGKAWR